MTSNHRPTLESKKGKKRAIGDTIVHARSLAQQTNLKYRHDTPIDISSEEVKQFHDQVNKKIKVSTRPDDEPVKPADNIVVVKELDGVLDLGKSLDSEVESGAESEGASEESDSESESDSEALLAELAKIKAEKEQKRAEQQKVIEESSKKKSWRTSAFKQKKPMKKPSQQTTFTTNSIELEYHQSFLSKFIR